MRAFLRAGSRLHIQWNMQASTATPILPPPVASYFAHETTNPEALSRCFTADGAVVDERHEYRGRDAIAQWNASTMAKTPFSTRVLAAERDGTDTVVVGRVSGDFPGSPVDLRFRFALQGDLITRLEIAP